MQTDIRLPDKASELIRLAIADLRKAMVHPEYRVNMGAWHEMMPRLEGGAVCHVCLAGSIMAFTLNAPPYMEVEPHDYDMTNRRKLYALNFVRRGQLHEAGVEWPAFKTIPMNQGSSLYVARFSDDPNQFIADMLHIADCYELAEKGEPYNLTIGMD